MSNAAEKADAIVDFEENGIQYKVLVPIEDVPFVNNGK